MGRDDSPAQLVGPAALTGGSARVWIGALLALTTLAVALGILLGQHLAGTVKKALQSSEQANESAAAPNYHGDLVLRELPAIVTNLADPPEARIRLQASIVFKRSAISKPDVIVAQIGEDILGFLRTLSLAQVGGPSGLQHLREDLNERAAIRSEGQVRELIIQAVVVQ